MVTALTRTLQLMILILAVVMASSASALAGFEPGKANIIAGNTKGLSEKAIPARAKTWATSAPLSTTGIATLDGKSLFVLSDGSACHACRGCLLHDYKEHRLAYRDCQSQRPPPVAPRLTYLYKDQQEVWRYRVVNVALDLDCASAGSLFAASDKTLLMSLNSGIYRLRLRAVTSQKSGSPGQFPEVESVETVVDELMAKELKLPPLRETFFSIAPDQSLILSFPHAQAVFRIPINQHGRYLNTPQLLVGTWDGKQPFENVNDKGPLPSGVTVDKDGYIYVADQRTNNVLKLDPDGSYPRVFVASDKWNTKEFSPLALSIHENELIVTGGSTEASVDLPNDTKRVFAVSLKDASVRAIAGAREPASAASQDRDIDALSVKLSQTQQVAFLENGHLAIADNRLVRLVENKLAVQGLSPQSADPKSPSALTEVDEMSESPAAAERSLEDVLNELGEGDASRRKGASKPRKATNSKADKKSSASAKSIPVKVNKSKKSALSDGAVPPAVQASKPTTKERKKEVESKFEEAEEVRNSSPDDDQAQWRTVGKSTKATANNSDEAPWDEDTAYGNFTPVSAAEAGIVETTLAELSSRFDKDERVSGSFDFYWRRYGAKHSLERADKIAVQTLLSGNDPNIDALDSFAFDKNVVKAIARWMIQWPLKRGVTARWYHDEHRSEKLLTLDISYLASGDDLPDIVREALKVTGEATGVGINFQTGQLMIRHGMKLGLGISMGAAPPWIHTVYPAGTVKYVKRANALTQSPSEMDANSWQSTRRDLNKTERGLLTQQAHTVLAQFDESRSVKGSFERHWTEYKHDFSYEENAEVIDAILNGQIPPTELKIPYALIVSKETTRELARWLLTLPKEAQCQYWPKKEHFEIFVRDVSSVTNAMPIKLQRLLQADATARHTKAIGITPDNGLGESNLEFGIRLGLSTSGPPRITSMVPRGISESL